MATAAPLRQPTLFIPHGAGPCFFMDWNPPTAWNRMADYLRSVGDTLPERPRAIVMVSAHWLEPAFGVTGTPRPELIYDYYGFPPHTYELRYPAPGEPALAERVATLLNQGGQPARVDPQRGFDHGMFIPLKLMFPDADIPVIQLSLRHDLDPQAHLDAGRALTPLRDQGVLIIGSGMSFHNMRAYGDARFGAPSEQFDRWLTETVEAEPAERYQRLVDWAQAPAARLCHPPRAEEHLIPLLVVAGAADEDPGRRAFTDQVLDVTLSAFHFG